ncbi:hypothetical protein COU53_00675 [Candidatus Pacearchaeota archaeon CG10_big_fil_rev_8_21_14_0_10_30_48]|nr:MAG: hypothetical protein COU53_00675 [Candidatus Pacearchaeota archaeon CG10_big_fil_rev_8_21_14_0_10_30_48]
MKIKSTIRFIDLKVKDDFYKLEKGDKSERELFKIISNCLDYLEENAFCGIQLSKKLIHVEFVKTYGIKNLWKYDLPRGWRLLYSVINEEAKIVSLVLEWSDHKNYERRFKY